MAAQQTLDNVTPINGAIIPPIAQDVTTDEPQQAAAQEKSRYKQASPELVALANSIIKGCHDHLKSAKIKYVFREGDWEQAGRRIPGKVKVIPADLKVNMECDFQISINQELFEMGNEKQKESLLDHLLCYCSYHENENSGVKVWKRRNPEIIEFPEVLARRGIWSADLKKMEQACKQINLFGADTENPSNLVN